MKCDQWELNRNCSGVSGLRVLRTLQEFSPRIPRTKQFCLRCGRYRHANCCRGKLLFLFNLGHVLTYKLKYINFVFFFYTSVMYLCYSIGFVNLNIEVCFSTYPNEQIMTHQPVITKFLRINYMF